MTKERPKREGVMLAYPVDEGRIARLGPNFFVQPKIKGERCRVEWFRNEPVLLSSYANEFKFLDHIKDALQVVGRAYGQVPFDGEIYKHGWSQQQIRSALGRTVNYNPESIQLEYYIFDVAAEQYDQAQRFWVLDEVSGKALFDKPLRFVRPATADFDTWRIAVQEYLDEGYEGIILRSMVAKYAPKRSVAMLKYKPTELDNYEIVTIKEAIDKYGDPKDTLGSFLVKDKDENVFYVGAGKLTWPERDRLWANREDLIGLLLVVKHEPIHTDRGVPICAVAVEVKGG
jgi:ATP-dependent DNA ligase